MDVQLVGVVEYGNASLDLHVVHGFEITDRRTVQIPDLGFQLPGLILQGQIAVLLSVFGQGDGLGLAEINAAYVHAVMKAVDIFHKNLPVVLWILLKRSAKSPIKYT